MVYYTPAFKEQFSNRTIAKIEAEIETANRVLSINHIPVQLDLFCSEELEGFVETEGDDKSQRLVDFWFAKSKYPHPQKFRNYSHYREFVIEEAVKERGVKAYMSLLNTADIGILMTNFTVSVYSLHSVMF